MGSQSKERHSNYSYKRCVVYCAFFLTIALSVINLFSSYRDTLSVSGQNINVGWSPDGNTVAFGDKDDKISFVDTRTWKV